MSQVNVYCTTSDLQLGIQHNARVPESDQIRQRREVEEILKRLSSQPGVILADKVGMGKTFVALAVAYCIAKQSRRRPVIVMTPSNLIDKWKEDLKTFCELYVDGAEPVHRNACSQQSASPRKSLFRYASARHSVDFLKLLDDPDKDRCQLIFLSQGAMTRSQSDKWVRLALIREALRRHGRENATRLIKVKKSIHKFLGELLGAKGEQSASENGKEIWQKLLKTDPSSWKDVFNSTLYDEKYELSDDPVPKSIIRTLQKGEIGLKRLAQTLATMPIRSMSKDSDSERITEVRTALKEIEENVWKKMLAKPSWQSPLLVIDEAHHLKNPSTRFAKQLQSLDGNHASKTGDGAMSKVFNRMLFLTATPFQLGHHELVRVLERFGDVRWGPSLSGNKESFAASMQLLHDALTESQRAAMTLQKSWASLNDDDLPNGESSDDWWKSIEHSPSDNLSPRQQGLLQAFRSAHQKKSEAEKLLKKWIVRHNKEDSWPVEPKIRRRQRFTGSGILDHSADKLGLEVPDAQLLPFYLAARSAVSPGKDLLGEALCSSYEAFRKTRNDRKADRDECEDVGVDFDFSHSDWYLSEFDRALEQCSGKVHPKVAATVKRVVDLWEVGEKVLVFAFYRQTCRALRLHISNEIERRVMTLARRRFADAGKSTSEAEIESKIAEIQSLYMDRSVGEAATALDTALSEIIDTRAEDIERLEMGEYRKDISAIMKRFLRVRTTLVRCFPICRDELDHRNVIQQMLEATDASGQSWQGKFKRFLNDLIDFCSKNDQRELILESLKDITTKDIYVLERDSERISPGEENLERTATFANVQVATGQTRREQKSRLMRAFNTPFFPDILVCSEVMSEGVDLHRYCRYVIHHDLAWNPSQIEQRTGRIDRLGCKAENRHPIHVYLPYVAGASDERQYRVISDREQWFRIVMGQDEVAKLIPPGADQERPPLPTAFKDNLSFQLGLQGE